MKKDMSSSSAPGQEERRDYALHAEKLHTSTGVVYDVENNKILPKITYLGYQVNVEGIRPSKDHTDAIRNYPIPKNAEQIKEIKEQLLIKEMPFYKLKNGMVFRKGKKKLTFYVPEEMEQNVIRTAHEDTAHLGVEKVTEYIRETCWFRNMKEKYGPRKGLLHNIDKGNKPFNTLYIDHLDPLEKCKQYHGHILVTIVAFSDHVVIKNFDNTPGVNKKLIPKFKGPYVVKKVLPNDRYAIGDPPDFQNTQIPFDGVVDSNNMKAWSKRI
ncbi:hypothetical protein Trydic_g13175 [Trypoxylus dichotomus]